MGLFDAPDSAPPPEPKVEFKDESGNAPELPVFDTIDKRILNFCEQVFWETGLVPTPERISDQLGIKRERVLRSFANDKFQQSLASRGIDLTPEVSGKVLDPRQIMLANLLLNLHDRRSIREKLKVVQVSSQQYNAWMRQPQFTEFLRKRGEALFKNSDHEAYKSLVTAVGRGDINALKLFFEMRGIYQPRLQLDVNIEAIMLRVVEVVSKYVTDPELLITIASELEDAMPQKSAVSRSITERAVG